MQPIICALVVECRWGVHILEAVGENEMAYPKKWRKLENKLIGFKYKFHSYIERRVVALTYLRFMNSTEIYACTLDAANFIMSWHSPAF